METRPRTYDGGGFSGGSMERSAALRRLLGHVRARKIDVIVVYKVDRLTRSLADFAKLVELFDAHGVSFNWAAEAFNTTTSMGRLTLNMLLSFAQFERKITGERIREKAAASKRKGIWMGGAVPLGYRVQDRPPQPVEGEAEFVRALFRCYLEIGRQRERSLANSDEQEGQEDRRRIDLARPSLLDPVEPGLCRTATPQRADSRREHYRS